MEVNMKKVILFITILTVLLGITSIAFAADTTGLIPLEIEEDPLMELMSALEDKCPGLYASGYYGEDSKYHIMSTNVAAMKKEILADRGLKMLYESISENIVFEGAEFTMAELEKAYDRIRKLLAGQNTGAAISLNSKKNTIEIFAGEEKIKPYKNQILMAADIKSSVSGVSLSTRLVFEKEMTIHDLAGGGDNSLELTADSVKDFLILDTQNQAYIKKSFRSLNRYTITSELLKTSDDIDNYILNTINGLRIKGKASPTGKTLPLREGEAVIFLNDGTRYSYYFEKDGTLNINGECYKVSADAAKTFRQRLTTLKACLKADMRPKWLSWMKPENVTAITAYTPNAVKIEVKKDNIRVHAWGLYRDICVDSGEKYVPGEEKIPASYDFKAELEFKSGVRITLVMNGKTLWIESSDSDYGCKYTIKGESWDEDTGKRYSRMLEYDPTLFNYSML
jgi:hypothetical protein